MHLAGIYREVNRVVGKKVAESDRNAVCFENRASGHGTNVRSTDFSTVAPTLRGGDHPRSARCSDCFRCVNMLPSGVRHSGIDWLLRSNRMEAMLSPPKGKPTVRLNRYA